MNVAAIILMTVKRAVVTAIWKAYWGFVSQYFYSVNERK